MSDHRGAAPGRIYLLRHAESAWNASGRWQGHADPPLSERGRRDVEARAASLLEPLASPSRRTLLFSSDLRRALETATCLGDAMGVRPVALVALRELDVGRWAGLTRAEIEVRDGALLAAFDSEDPDVRPGGGECRRELRVRVRTAVEELVARHPGADLLLVVHLGVIRALVPGASPANLELVTTDLEAIRKARERT